MEYSKTQPFSCKIKGVDGESETLSFKEDNLRMQENSCRSIKHENSYVPGVLIGNYNEERFDLREIKKNKPLPSQYGHYYQGTYAESYNREPLHQYPHDLKLLKCRLPHAYPIHQPELDTQKLKVYANSWETTQRASFLNPYLRLQPIKGEHDKIDFTCEQGQGSNAIFKDQQSTEKKFI